MAHECCYKYPNFPLQKRGFLPLPQMMAKSKLSKIHTSCQEGRKVNDLRLHLKFTLVSFRPHSIFSKMYYKLFDHSVCEGVYTL